LCASDTFVKLLLTVWEKHWKTFWRQWCMDGIQCISSWWLQACYGGQHLFCFLAVCVDTLKFCVSLTALLYSDMSEGW